MGTTEWIALGLLLVALTGWLRWRGTVEDGKRMRSTDVRR